MATKQPNRKKSNAANAPTPKRRLATTIVLSTCALVLVAAMAVAIISYNLYKKTFYEYSNQMCLQSNAQAAYLINGDLIEHYANTLQPNAEYEEMVEQLDGLKLRMGTKHLYILADTGVPGMYTYIYDSTGGQHSPHLLGDTESMEELPGADEVLTHGEAFTSARYHKSAVYGQLYYALAPIYNSRGQVVAFIGSDVDLAPLQARLGQYRLVILITILLILAGFLCFYYLIINKLLFVPMGYITREAQKISRGDLTLHLPPNMANSQNEVGQLTSAFQRMASSVQSLGQDIGNTMQAARSGYLWERADASRYDGEYYTILSGANTALDVVCWHFDALPEAIAILGADKSLRYSNRAMDSLLELHGLDPKQDNFLARLVSSGESDVLEHWVSLLLSGDKLQPFTRDISLPTPNRLVRNYNLSVLRTLGATTQDDEHSVMLMLNDVTTLTRALETAQQASNAKTEFLSRMSHEIRTPMNAIIGMSQIAQKTDNIGKIHSSFQKIETSSTHLLGLLNDILDLSKIEAGKLTLNNGAVCLADDLDSVFSIMKDKAKEKNLKLVLKKQNVQDSIWIDALRLNQVLINLLGNAIKFSKPGGTITLEATRCHTTQQEASYYFAVSDEGIGIAPHQIERLFQPFEQANPGVAQEYGGTGLGLTISRRIIEMMGGQIAVKSSPGHGSVFHFTITTPLCHGNEEATPRQNTQLDVYNFEGMRALVVDDIEINREIVLELLQDTNLAMETAANGQQAVDMFTASPPQYYNVILMDMQMPEVDGCTATEMIRRLPRPDAASIPIIAMTANVMQEDVKKALQSGMNAHVGKPLNLQELKQVIARTTTSET